MGERILREEGYEVVSVTDGDVALKRLSDVDPDLIVADVFLPGVNGFELCRKVKAQPAHRHVRVVMTAGMLEVFDEDEAKRAGADAIIKKPFEASVVIETIKPLIVEAHLARGLFPQAAASAAVVDTPVPQPPTVEQHPVVVVEDDYVPEPELDLPDEYGEPAPPEPAPVVSPATVAPASTGGRPATAIDAELVRAAVTLALDEALPSLIDQITERVVASLRKNQ